MQRAHKKILFFRRFPFREKLSLTGFTLAEIIVVIVILSIITGITVLLLGKVLEAHFFVVENKDILDESRAAFERIINDLRQIRAPTDINIYGTEEISFRNVMGREIHLVVSGDTLLRNGKVITGDIAPGGGFRLTYWDMPGNQLVEPFLADDIWVIAVALKLEDKGRDVRLRTQVFPRNFNSEYNLWEID